LSCVYSESRVGKVVGKRRKRPVDDSIGNINSQSWIVNTAPAQSIPSPANTQGSEESAKRHCGAPSWTSFIAGGDEQGFLTFDESTDALHAIDMTDNRSFSMTSDMTFFNNSGLPTPALSPPQFTRYLSPAQLETRPASRHTFVPADPSKLQLPQHNPAVVRHVENMQEDEEMVCIKLLAHLKKHASEEMQPREVQIELLRKCNAAMQRILRSKTIRSDYACHLVLSSIITHLVRLCERLCLGKMEEPRAVDSQFLQDQVHFAEAMPGFFDAAISSCSAPGEQEQLINLVKEVMQFISAIGEMLKRKPIQGFQYLGRHETLHVELEQRLRQASMLLQS
jgi:hypothetical protein